VRRQFFSIILSLIFASCAATLPYATDFPLTQELFHSRDGVLTGKVPQGWFSSTDDTLAPALILWLIREDFSAALTVREIKLDLLSSQHIEKEGLEPLALMSAGLHDENLPTKGIETQEFKINKNKFCSYEIGSGISRKRFVVFVTNGKYYECEAQPLKGIWTGTDLARLFTTQQTVLSSLSF
jgi:hypothetical protein